MHHTPTFPDHLAPATLVVLTCIAARRELIARKGEPFIIPGGRRRFPACRINALVADGLASITTSERGIRRVRLTPAGTAVAQVLIAARSPRPADA